MRHRAFTAQDEETARCPVSGELAMCCPSCQEATLRFAGCTLTAAGPRRTTLNNGLYNLLLGSYPIAPVVIFMLQPIRYGRLRDAWVERMPDGVRLAIYTRDGGANRAHRGEGPPGLTCDCTGCAITFHLPAHPLYLGDEDNDTYATVYFKLPPNANELLAAAGAPVDAKIEAFAIDPPDMKQRMADAIKALKGSR